MAKQTIKVITEHGTFTRQTARPYAYIVIVKGKRAEVLEARRLDEIAVERRNARRYRAQVATGVSDCPRAYSVEDLAQWAVAAEARAAALEARGPITVDEGDTFDALGWCSRFDLARKLADSTDAARFRSIEIVDIATGAIVPVRATL